MRKWIALAAGVGVLAIANYAIYSKERLLAAGQMVLLELAPVDPRSLMQGDYMALRFRVADEVLGRAREGLQDGHVVLALDADRVGHFARLGDCRGLAAGEVCMRYRVRAERVKFATNAYFFQEGDAALYEGARFGEFRVDPTGEAILVAMRGADRAPLGRSSKPSP